MYIIRAYITRVFHLYFVILVCHITEWQIREGVLYISLEDNTATLASFVYPGLACPLKHMGLCNYIQTGLHYACIGTSTHISRNLILACSVWDDSYAGWSSIALNQRITLLFRLSFTIIIALCLLKCKTFDFKVQFVWNFICFELF